MRRGRGRYRRTPTACLAARASLYLYGWNPLRSTRFRADKTPQRLDRLPAPPRGSRADWLKSLTLSTSTASPGHGKVRQEVAARAGCRGGPPFFGEPGTSATNSRWPDVEKRFSSYTIRPGTTPVARDGRFRAALPRLRAHVTVGLYRLPINLFSERSLARARANSRTF